MKYGYARISTIDPDMQLKALKRAGCAQIFTDKKTGDTPSALPYRVVSTISSPATPS
jgi:DNA invertase Pin-like site-specific DNA recombinase